MSDRLREKSLNFPLSISVSHLLFLFITRAHSLAPAICANLRQNSSPSPVLHSAITWAFFMLYYHLIRPFFCHSSTLCHPFFLSDERQRKSIPAKWIWHAWCVWLWMGAQDISSQQSFVFACFLFFYFFGPPMTRSFLLAESEKDITDHLPDLALQFCVVQGIFSGLDKIFILLIPKLTQWCVKN